MKIIKEINALVLSVSVDRDKVTRMLTQDEARRNYPYDDATGKAIFGRGKVSIGVGRNLEATPLSDLIIDIILLEDVAKAEAGARKIVGSTFFDRISENRKLAIINLVFNLGEGGFRAFQNTIAAIKKEDWLGASKRILESKYATQVKERAKRVSLMLKDDVFPYK